VQHLNAVEFVNAVFAGGAGHVAVWRLPNRDAAWFPFPLGRKDAESLSALVDKWNLTADGVYVCMTLQREVLPRPSRGTAANAAGSSALWADIDLHDPAAHKSPALPRSVEEVQKALSETGLPAPSITVHSGHGLYALWLLNAFAEAGELAPALANVDSALSRVWSSRGWHLDKTGDLARVLRLPGTTNRKTLPGSPVRVLSAAGARYPLGAFTGGAKPGGPARLPETVAEGQRNSLLTSLAGSLRRRGASPEALEAALSAVNRAQCNPPLPEGEVRAIARSVGRYAPSPFSAAQAALVPLESIERHEVQFLINPYIPRGEITLLDGNPGIGKSWVWMAFVAGLTGSKSCPVPYDHTARQDCRVVILTSEDDPNKTLRPRLEALGAGLPLISIAKVGENFSATAADLEAVRPLVTQAAPDLVVIDPLTLWITTTTTDTDKAEQVRRVLTPLVVLARELNCAILCVRHFRKSGGAAIHRGLGSIDFTGTARSLLVVDRDKNSGQRAVAHAKSNLAVAGETLSFELGGPTGFTWLGTLDGVTADDLTLETKITNGEERRAIDTAKKFLLELLAAGPVPNGEVKRGAIGCGISMMTLRRAADALNVNRHQVKGKYPPEWVWELPSGIY
jgi:hypothetical protein